MAYLEPLTEGYPPEDAEEILEPRIAFRTVRNNPPTAEDFRSQRAESPNGAFNVCECTARGLSVRDNVRDAEQLIKLRKYKNGRVSRVNLTTGAGRIKQTFRRSHFTWWPLADFDILGNSEVL